MFTQSSILSSQLKTRMMCLSLPLNLGSTFPFHWKNVPIPIKGMYPSSLLNRDLTKLPCDQGLASSSSLGGNHGTTNYLWNSLFRCNEFILCHGVDIHWDFFVGHRPSITLSSLSHVIIPFIGKWSISPYLAFLHAMLPSSCHVSLRIFHPTTWSSSMEDIHSYSLGNPA